jgi:hypothetical protein
MKYSDWMKMGASKVTPIQYLTPEDFHLLRAEMQQNKEKVDKDCEYLARRIADLYERHDIMREDLNVMRWHDDALRHLLNKMDELECAPKARKRRRRVTISYD